MMPRGRFWFGPGFWKWGTGWFPGSGGFRGGAYPYGGPGLYWPGWRHCWWFPWNAGYLPVSFFPPYNPKDEASFLKEQLAGLQSEIDSIRKRLKELQNPSEGHEEN